jgi:pyrroline-5-carboxylate reductase
LSEAPIAGRLLMVGCGTMGSAMLGRWLASGVSPEQVTVVSPSGRAMPNGVTVVREVPAGDFDVIVLALKPQQLNSLRGGALAGHAPALLLSILAGVEEAALAGLCGAQAVVRAMPNLPVAIGRGVTALCSRSADALARATAEALAAPLGHHEWIADEAQFDAVTALAGSGPGFTFRWIEALAAGGASLGLPADQAMRLALATVEGSALMAADSDASPGTLADRVASPGGSTREGLNVLDQDGALVGLVTDTLAAATRRNAEMAAAARD